MSMRGKILGVILGLIIFKSPIGIFLGFVAGYFLDRAIDKAAKKNVATVNVSAEELKQLFMSMLFSSLGHLAKSDGRVSEIEISHTEMIIKRFNLDESSREQAIRWFKQGSAQDNNYDDLLDSFSRAVRNKPEIKKVLLETLIGLALVDGDLHKNEEVVLLKIATNLGVPQAIFQLLLNQLKGQQKFQNNTTSVNQLDQAYQSLGVTDKNSMDEIKKAYRKLMSEHHPDKLMAQGVPEHVIKLATEKTQVIQAAYEMIKKHRK